ncbi:MAG: glycoside hydrolase family 26 protein [Solirubrobacteraceae bacterium]
MLVAAAAGAAVAGAIVLASPAAAQTIAIGARIPGVPLHPELIDAYARAVGRSPAIVSWYREWGQTVFDEPSLRAATSRGAAPMITWEPTVPGWRQGERSTILETIATGAADGYLRAQAIAAARWRKPILLRFAPEMNGGWSPWGVRVPGNSAGLYVAAWRHAVAIFRRAGARNVLWVWCPNVDDGGALPFTALYPGDRWVDWVGLDGYNWGRSWDWLSFTAIFASSYDTTVRLSPKPMLIAETGSGEDGGSKAAWIRDMFGRELPRFTRVRALVWFNGAGDNGADFRFDSSASAALAFRQGLSSPLYDATGSAVFVARSPSPKFTPVPVPPLPKHGLARAGQLAARYWGIAAACVALAAVAVLALRRSRPRGAAPKRRRHRPNRLSGQR